MNRIRIYIFYFNLRMLDLGGVILGNLWYGWYGLMIGFKVVGNKIRKS